MEKEVAMMVSYRSAMRAAVLVLILGESVCYAGDIGILSPGGQARCLNPT
jgi:hypothetical protein